jgi:hypothetical protein
LKYAAAQFKPTRASIHHAQKRIEHIAPGKRNATHYTKFVAWIINPWIDTCGRQKKKSSTQKTSELTSGGAAVAHKTI